MKIRFSPEAARRELTPIDNLFFLEYMPDADGTFVKAYLYGLMQCYHPSLADADIGEALHLSEAQVRCAFVYWQAKGLVRILDDDPLSVEYLLTEQPAVTTATPKKYRRFIESLNALLSPRTLNLREMQAMYDCIELYGLDEGAVLTLAAHCMDQKGKRVSANYILSVAQTWSEADIKTQAQAEDYVTGYRLKKHGSTEILRRWNKTRMPTVDEMALYDRWINEYGFDAETILTVCEQLIHFSNPTFANLDKLLCDLKEQHVTDADAYFAAEAKNAEDRDFAQSVFKHLEKAERPTLTNISQLVMFRDQAGIPAEAILLAADACRETERPFGALKKILSQWAKENVQTVERARELLQQETIERKPKSKKNAGYATRTITMDDLKDIIVDLNEDL